MPINIITVSKLSSIGLKTCMVIRKYSQINYYKGIPIVYNVNPLQGTNFEWPEWMRDDIRSKLGFIQFQRTSQSLLIANWDLNHRRVIETYGEENH